MPLVKTIKDGNTTTEIHDEMEGLGKLSADEVLAKTGSKAGQFTEIQADGSKITYFVEEVRTFWTNAFSSFTFWMLMQWITIIFNFVYKFHPKEEESEFEVTEYEVTTTTTKTVIESGSGPSTQVIKKSSTSSAGGPSAQIVKTSGGGAAEITVNLHYLLYLLFNVPPLYVLTLGITFSPNNNCRLQITKDVSIPIQRETKVIETSGKVEVCITKKFSHLKLFITIIWCLDTQ